MKFPHLEKTEHEQKLGISILRSKSSINTIEQSRFCCAKEMQN